MNLLSRVAEILDLPLDELMHVEAPAKDEAATILAEMHDCLAALKETTALAIARCRLLRHELERHRMDARRSAQRACHTFANGKERQELIQELEAEEVATRQVVKNLKALLHSLERRLSVTESRRKVAIAGRIPSELSHADLLVAEFNDLERRFEGLIEEWRLRRSSLE